jgi:hypothetical protein
MGRFMVIVPWSSHANSDCVSVKDPGGKGSHGNSCVRLIDRFNSTTAIAFLMRLTILSDGPSGLYVSIASEAYGDLISIYNGGHLPLATVEL